MKIYDFNNCQSNNNTYGGMAGSKLGIYFNDENWLLKFPKNTKSMNEVDISYTTAPLSEYIGSHVYEILGFDVHETLLGIRDNKLVVACRDFLKNGEKLQEFREIKNYYNKELEEKLDQTIDVNSELDTKTKLETILIHLQYNPLILSTKGLKERFWNCVIVDGLINNNDRNGGNWGIVRHIDNSISLAPIYDNGASFSNKMSESKMHEFLSNPEKLKNSAMNITTGYSLNNQNLNFSKLLKINNSDLENALIRVVPLIIENMDNIKEMINNIPNVVKDIDIISEERKEFYIKGMEIRLNDLLIPAYEKAKKDI